MDGDTVGLQAEIDALRAQLAVEREAHRQADKTLARTEAALAHFVPRQFLELLGKEHLADLSLGDAVERKLTILFLDIRGFTPMCEGLTPSDTFRFVNAFLGELEPEIERHRGFVDKYIGDAIMALFPGGAADAIAGAQAMLEALDRFNAARARAGLSPVRIGIGLNTGTAIVGTVGGSGRMETTVLSDAVNLAARLEELSKRYGVPLLISEATVYALGQLPGPTVRFLDRIRVKGKTQPQSVYEVFGCDAPKLRAAKEATRARFEEAVAWYHLREIDRARPLLEACLAEAPDDEPARVYLERCRAYQIDGRHEGTGELSGTVAWRDEFTLGYEPIDAQHHELLAAFNRLAPGLVAGDTDGVREVFAFLERYVDKHFGLEERLMARHAYPLMAEHVREHRSFVEHFERLRRQVESGRHEHPFLVFLVQIFLIDWFANHSTGTDRHLARHLRRIGVG
ncbi:MAG: bacteriohemerythrin [Deltaproteobacteria bacterium]|nr:bacteriohemerythrin [Deltaproteobacteria bacterium]